MKRLTRVTAAAAAVALSLSMMSFTAAPAPQTEPERFDAFLDTLPAILLDGDDITARLFFENPQSFGLGTTLELPFISNSDLLKQGTGGLDSLLKSLSGFDYKKLSESQQISYDTIKEHLTLEKALTPYVYLGNDYLGAACSLPQNLILFTFHSKQDVDDYLNLLKTAKEAFVKYAQNEQERQDKGVGLSPSMIRLVIEQCDHFVNSSTDYLVTFFDEQINAASFLTAAEKNSAKQTNKRLVKNDFTNAYRTLRREVASIKVKSPEGGLSKRTDGKAYYEKLVQADLGTHDSIETIRQLLKNGLSQYDKKLQAILDDPSQKFITDKDGNLLATDQATAEGLISSLYEGSKADFPTIGKPKYTVKQIPASLSPYFDLAAYVIPRVDASPTDPQLILLNGAYSPNTMDTVAHEAIPGHMYQYNFIQMLNLPAVRKLIGFRGSAEGWANYVTEYAAEYVPEAYRPTARYVVNDVLRSFCVQALLDIGVNYDGWTREQALTFFQQYYGKEMALADSNIWYDYCLKNPGTYLPYAAGPLYFQQMRTKAENALGKDFSPVEFHQEVLKAGNTTFSVYQKQVDKYIANKLAARKAA